MSGIGDWFREFWRHPVAARALITVLFLSITSLYCFGFASLVAGSRLRPVRNVMSLATLTPESRILGAPTSAPAPTLSVTPTAAAAIKTPTAVIVATEIPPTGTPSFEPIIVRRDTSTPEPTHVPTAAPTTTRPVVVASKTATRVALPTASKRKSPTARRTPVATPTVTPTRALGQQ